MIGRVRREQQKKPRCWSAPWPVNVAMVNLNGQQAHSEKVFFCRNIELNFVEHVVHEARLLFLELA